MSDSGVCIGCRGACSPGFHWHRDCLTRYRRSVDYRTATLERDGFHCRRCLPAWNRLIVRDQYAGTLRLWPWGRRRVDVDHIVTLAEGGAQDPSNWQVLCKRHHRAKTRVDLRRLKGLRPPLPLVRFALLAVAALLLLRLAPDGATANLVPRATADPLGTARAVALALAPTVGTATVLGVLAWGLARYRRTTLQRIHGALVPVTGDSIEARRPIRVHRWGWVRPGDARLPRPVPTSFTLRYPHTFGDAEPERREAVEERVKAKLGWGTMTARWDTARDRVRLATPDPFVVDPPKVWPLAVEPGPRSLWDPIPVGVDENGREVSISLVERNILVGGEPGGGKSNVVSMLVGGAAYDADARLFLVDGKQVELTPWRRCAERVVTTQRDTLALLQELQQVMDLRYSIMAAEGRRKIERDDGMSLVVLVIDELALFTAGGDKKTREAIVECLRDIKSRGRAAGIIEVSATQRPSADVVPTALRDLFAFRWALRCTTPTSSDMVLAQGWASRGFSAHRIDPEAKGAGFLLAEGGLPRLMRAYLVDDAALARCIAEAERIRGVKASDDRPRGASAPGPAGAPVPGAGPSAGSSSPPDSGGPGG